MGSHVHTILSETRAEALAAASRGQRRTSLMVWALTLALLITAAVALTAAGAIPILADTSALPRAKTAGEKQPIPETVNDRSGTADVRGEPATVQATWGGPAVHLDWEGKQYATAEATFVGERVLSPGDRIEHTLTAANAGPTEAVAQITLVPHRAASEHAQNRGFGDDVTVFWDIAGVTGSSSYGELLREASTAVAEVAVPQGEEISVTIGVLMEADAETSRALGTASTALEFEVGVQFSGALVPGAALPLAVTGAVLPVALAALAVITIALGLMLILVRRRRKQEEEIVVVEEQ